ncbi:MAG: DMT family transporter [Verrucomicrobiales bacterium]
MPRTQANLILLFAGAIWGMGFVAQSSAMNAIGPFLFIGLRFALATVVVLPFAMREARCADHPLDRQGLTGLLWIGVILFLGMASQQTGLLTTTVTNSGFLTGLYVVFTPIIAVLFLRERPHAIVWPGALLALTGIFLLSGGNLSTLSSGDLLTILCAVFWAIQVILIGKFGKRTGRPLALSAIQFAVCAVLALAIAIVLEPFDWVAVRAASREILFAGIFSSGVAFTLQAVAQRHTTPSQAAIFLSSEALFAALFGALLLGERISGIGYIGCALILSAMLLVEIVPELRKKNREA